MKRFWMIGGAAVGLTAGAALAVAGTTGRLEVMSSRPSAPAATDQVRPVRVHRVATTAPAVRTYTGVVKPRCETDLGFRVAGKVVARAVEVGDRVSAGQVIARLDPADYRLSVQVAEADLAAARAEARNAAKEEERHHQMSAAAAVSRGEQDRVTDGRAAADARVTRAERSLALANNRLGYTELAADADGVVTALPVEVGQVVAEGTPVARVARAGELEAVVNLPENRAGDARSTARAAVWGQPGGGYAVKLRELSPAADPTTRTYQARFAIPNPGPDVTIGRTVTIHLDPAPARPTVTVPLTAVRQHDGRPAVWRVDGDRLVSVPVVVVGYRDDAAVIAEGVRPGDVVVAAGVQKLDAGLRVRPWEGK